MERLFAIGTLTKDNELKLSFVTISEDDMAYSENLGVDALTIMKVKALGFDSVMDFADEFMLEPSIGGSVEDIVNLTFHHYEVENRIFKEYT